ncbi:MAG: IS1634 family transposase [Clostridiales bacterium]|nr:IS1634 family transposase [Clostridiales bacterium]
MRLKITQSKNARSLYVIKSFRANGKNTSKIVEKLGTYDELLRKLNGQDPIAWAKAYIEELNRKDKEENRKIMVQYSPAKLIAKDEQHSFNAGYLFLQQIYHQLKLHDICRTIADKYKFSFSLDAVLSRLVYGRILFPASKSATCQLSARFIEQSNFELQHIYRALEVIAKETDFIQSELYKNSLALGKRNCGVLYYDCTNYFFEIEQEEGLKQYGYSKEHRPNPLVQMGLFMDGDGIPLAFDIHAGNTNEQVTLTPLEQKILDDFGVSKFVVCTDAGLASYDNRRFNDRCDRAFITTQSIKTLKAYLKEWALHPAGWRLMGGNGPERYDISTLDEQKDRENTYYKERWINENGLEQKLIVTYSIKHREYQREVRNGQIERAAKLIGTRPGKLKKCGPNDCKRFIAKTTITADGEVAEKTLFSIDTDIIAAEEAFDGFYGTCTNLEDEAPAIMTAVHRRWEIEECFRILKSEFKARPVYLSRDDRIRAHFVTCFIALSIYRFLEKKLSGRFTCRQIIQGLRDMNFLEIPGDGFVPNYTRSDFTDALHAAFGFRTDYQILSKSQFKKISAATKK